LLVVVDSMNHKIAEDEAQRQLSDAKPILREAESFGGLKKRRKETCEFKPLDDFW
jgi:hypothetical protein